MNSHPYIRAYMAGALLPTWFLLLVLAGIVAEGLLYEVPKAVERIIIFPMAVVPNLWGLWNTFYVAKSLKHRISLGAWGALLPLVLVPSGLGLERALGVSLFTALEALVALPVIAAVYYLVWKHIVRFFNHVVGVG